MRRWRFTSRPNRASVLPSRLAARHPETEHIVDDQPDGRLRSFARSAAALACRAARPTVGAVLLVVVVLAPSVWSYGAAALAESAVSRRMREQLDLADDPSVRFNRLPVPRPGRRGRLPQRGRHRRAIAVGPLRDVQLRTQLRDVQVPLSELLGGGPRTVTVREAEGTVRIEPAGPRGHRDPGRA